MSRVKKIAFLVPRLGMDESAFRAYWRSVHGPLVATSPDYGAWRSFYAQNHPIAAGPFGQPFAYSGMAVFILPGHSSNEESFSQTDIYRNRIAIDEAKFIDMERTVSFAAREIVLLDGHGPAKLVATAALASGSGGEKLMRTAAQPGIAAMAELRELGLCGWSMNFAIPGTVRLPGGRAAGGLNVDIVHEFWFRGTEELRACTASQAFEAAARGTGHDPTSSFVAEELIFFDGGSRSTLR